MELLKNNRWVVLLLGVILIFICAATVWASNDVRPSYAEAAGAEIGSCELTDVVFDEVLHPALTAKNVAWTQKKDAKSVSLTNEKKIESSSAAQVKKVEPKTTAKTSKEEKNVSGQKTEKTIVSSKETQNKASSNVSDPKKSNQKTAASTTVSAQKPATVVQADIKKEKSAETDKAAQSAAGEAASYTPPTQLLFSKTALLSQDQAAEATWSYALSKEDLLLLERIVMAESEGEPYAGKVAVANVVLNRLRSANYPNTIRDVIYQRYQFSPVQNGRFDRVVPSEDSVKAAAEALNGRKEVPDDTYFFVSLELATDMTIPNTRTPVRKIGHHTFFK